MGIITVIYVEPGMSYCRKVRQPMKSEQGRILFGATFIFHLKKYFLTFSLLQIYDFQERCSGHHCLTETSDCTNFGTVVFSILSTENIRVVANYLNFASVSSMGYEPVTTSSFW